MNSTIRPLNNERLVQFVNEYECIRPAPSFPIEGKQKLIIPISTNQSSYGTLCQGIAQHHKIRSIPKTIINGPSTLGQTHEKF
ncbi:MAG: hypothetical protein ABI707_16455 [Ferruginibacter sp.]